MSEIFRFVNLTRFRLEGDPGGSDRPPKPEDSTDEQTTDPPAPPVGPVTEEVLDRLTELADDPGRLRAAAHVAFDQHAYALREQADTLFGVVRWARRRPTASMGDLRAMVKERIGDAVGLLRSLADETDRSMAAYAASFYLSPGSKVEERRALVGALRGLFLIRLTQAALPDENVGAVALAANAPPPRPSAPPTASKIDPQPAPEAGAPLTLDEITHAQREVRAARSRRPTPAPSPEPPEGERPAKHTPPDTRDVLPKGALSDSVAGVLRRVGTKASAPVTEILGRLGEAARTHSRQAVSAPTGRTVVPYAGGLIRLPTATPQPSSQAAVSSALVSGAVPTSVGTARVLGVGELMVVREELDRYETSAIAHIENVVASESRGRTHTSRTETTTTTSLSTYELEASTHELATASRFELENAASKTATRATAFGVGTSVSGGVGPVNVAVEASFSTSSSTTETESSATTFAQEVTEKATSELRNEVRTASQTEIRTLTEEVNDHRFENGDGDHITGTYRWVDKVVSAQVLRYGQRMMLEFVVPEPAAYLLAALGGAPTAADGVVEPPPFVYDEDTPLEPEHVTETGYLSLAAIWGAEGIEPPPPEFTSLAVTMAFEPANPTYSSQGSTGIVRGWSNKVATVNVPAGYRAHEFRITSTFGSHAMASEGDDGIEKVRVGIGNDYRSISNESGRSNPIWGRVEGPSHPNDDGSGLIGELPIVATANQRRGVAIAIEVVCERTDEHLDAWRYATYQQLRAAYDAAYATYKADLEMATFGGPPVGLNPGTLRDTEAREIKRGCLELLTAQSFDGFGALSTGSDGLPVIDAAEAEAEGEYMQFFEDAFEWHLQSYVLYPYLWAGRSKHVEMLARTSTDPTHEAFLQAGAARVTVPVRPGYDVAVARYLADGVLWNGFGPPTPEEMEDGEVPFLPVFELLAERLGRPGDEALVGEPWEVTVPTPLVYLQPTAELNPAPGS